MDLQGGFVALYNVGCMQRALWVPKHLPTVELKNDYVLGFIICEVFTVIALQDWVGWGIFTVIPGCPLRTNGDSQHLEAFPKLQDWLQSELFTVQIQDRAFAEIIR